MVVLYLIICLIVQCILGAITYSISQSKGYDGGFWWGFLLGVIGIIVVACRTDLNLVNALNNQRSESQSGWSVNKNDGIDLPQSSGWICEFCGQHNSGSLSYCLKCRRSKSESDSKQTVYGKKICPKCGTENRGFLTLCSHCGANLDEQPAAATETKTALPDAAPTADQSEEDVEGVRLLKQLAALHDAGVLTDEEFAQKKAEILSRM